MKVSRVRGWRAGAGDPLWLCPSTASLPSSSHDQCLSHPRPSRKIWKIILGFCGKQAVHWLVTLVPAVSCCLPRISNVNKITATTGTVT